MSNTLESAFHLDTLARGIAKAYQDRVKAPHDLVSKYGLSLAQATKIYDLSSSAYGPSGKGEAWFIKKIKPIITNKSLASRGESTARELITSVATGTHPSDVVDTVSEGRELFTYNILVREVRNNPNAESYYVASIKVPDANVHWSASGHAVYDALSELAAKMKRAGFGE